jgi:hypothetical protein
MLGSEAPALLATAEPLLAPIFIVGLNKSGTSLLYLLLSRHESVSAIKAFKAFTPKGPGAAMLHMEKYGIGEGQKIPGLPDKLQKVEGGSGRFAGPAFLDQYRLTEADVEPGDAVRVAAAYRGAMVRPEARLCEKSPPNILRMRYLQALFPDAVFVAVVRDPYANVSANGKKRSKWGGVEEQARHWAAAYATFLEDRSRLRRCLLVRYEQLVDDPQGELRRICAFCGVPDVDAGVDGLSIEQNVNASLIGLLSSDDFAVISRICGPTMRALDYPVRSGVSG